jgi:hypothetical protein
MDDWSPLEIQTNQREIYDAVVSSINRIRKINYADDPMIVTLLIEEVLDYVSSAIEDGFFDVETPYGYLWDMVTDLENWTTNIPFYTRKYHMFFGENQPRAFEDVPAIGCIEGNGNCPICMDSLTLIDEGIKVCQLPCGHCFHESCIKTWLTERREICPVCKKDFSLDDLECTVPNRIVWITSGLD